LAKLPRLSGRECAKAFQKAGFYFVRQGKGDHKIYRRDEPFAQLSIPDHDELDRGLLRSLIRAASMTVDEFVKLL
jgi:predicted RNA binding protein YcfA (HicA-like mRNA interferase family)